MKRIVSELRNVSALFGSEFAAGEGSGDVESMIKAQFPDLTYGQLIMSRDEAGSLVVTYLASHASDKFDWEEEAWAVADFMVELKRSGKISGYGVSYPAKGEGNVFTVEECDPRDAIPDACGPAGYPGEGEEAVSDEELNSYMDKMDRIMDHMGPASPTAYVRVSGDEILDGPVAEASLLDPEIAGNVYQLQDLPDYVLSKHGIVLK